MLRVSKQIKDKDGNYSGVTIHAEGANTAEVFEKVAKLQEVFGDAVARKGNKAGHDVQYRVREVEGNKFYELCFPVTIGG